MWMKFDYVRVNFDEFEWNVNMLLKLDYVTKVSLNLIMLYEMWVEFAYVTLSLNGNWLCCSNLIMLLYFHLIWLCYIFSIIHHVIIICRVSRWKSYFIAFHIYKVGVGFTSRSESTRHPFGNDAYFGQPENGDQRVLSGYASFCVSFVCGFASITRCSPSHRYWACDRRTTELAAEITNRSYMRASVNR
jgi:hypothetical protein